MLKGFQQFILRGNVVDLAVGVVVGAAFTTLVNAMVKDLITPLIGAIIKAPDFSGLAFTVNGSRFMYGEFINAAISFIIIAGVVYFFVVVPINMLIAKTKRNVVEEPTTKKCIECLSEVPILATRCAHCAVVFVKN